MIPFIQNTTKKTPLFYSDSKQISDYLDSSKGRGLNGKGHRG